MLGVRCGGFDCYGLLGYIVSGLFLFNSVGHFRWVIDVARFIV